MKLHFEPITSANRAEILELSIYSSQLTFIESIEDCLAEAAHDARWRPIGIYDAELSECVGGALGKPVGFAMYGFFDEYRPAGRVWLDRLLIDRRYQGRGYGHVVLPMLIGKLRGEYGCDEVYLSVTEGNDAAVRLYSGLGFRFTGELDVHGERVMRLS